MIKKKDALGKFLSILAIICLLFTTFSPLKAGAEGANPSLTTNKDGQYIISKIEDINKFRTDLNNGIDYTNKIVLLDSDIAITDDKPLIPTTGTFQGFFNGQGHSIKNYNDPLTGFVCKIGSNGVITNLHINMKVDNASGLETDKILSPEIYCYGSIANESNGKISLCTVDGTLTTNSREAGNGFFSIGGISGQIVKQNSNTIVENCYSRLEIKAQTGDTYLQFAAGIAYDTIGSDSTKIIKNCYAAGKIEACAVMGVGCGSSGDYPSTYYDSNIINASDNESGGNAKSTEEMKQKATYAGWDFDKVWDIKPDVNDGYPYLRPNQIVDEPVTAPTDMPVDVNINIADKTVKQDGTVDLKADYICSITNLDNQTITGYDVKVTLSGKLEFSGFTGNNIPINYIPERGQSSHLTSDILRSNLKVTYNDNKKYKFQIGKVTFNSPNFYNNGITTVPEDKKVKQIENAKKAQDILYNKLKVGQGNVPEFTWSGSRASTQGEEGHVELNDYVWEVFSSARSGYKGVRSGFYDNWFKNIQDGLKKMKAAGITAQDVKMTEWDKLALAITAIGYDPRDIESYDLIDIISNKDYLSTSKQTFSGQYSFLALNSYNYPIPKEGNRIDKDKLIDSWTEYALGSTGADGSAEQSNTVGDMWTMAFQPIASYYNPNAKEGDKYYDVKRAMEYAFNRFSNAQTYKGSFYGGYNDEYNNPWTNAQVYITLGMSKSNIFDSKYIKNGNSILDGALEFYNIEESTTTFNSSTYEPLQMCRGLDSLVRSYEGRNSIFDCTDVKNSTVSVNNAIADLPELDKLTALNKAQVEAAKALYDGLSDAKKTSMKDTTKAKLVAAEAKVNESSEPTSMQITNLTSDSTVKLGNDAKVSVKAVNNSSKAEDAVLIVALYDGSGKSIRYTCGKNAIKAGDSSVLTAKISLPSEGIYTLKAFVCDSLESMKPISNIIDIPIK